MNNMAGREVIEYVVVEFTDEDIGGLAVVPSNWLDGVSCSLWPPYTENGRCERAVKHQEVPQDSWKSYPIKEWCRKANYRDAKEKCQHLLDHSGLESTDHETMGRSKRKRKRNERYDSESKRSRSRSPEDIQQDTTQKSQTRNLYTPKSTSTCKPRKNYRRIAESDSESEEDYAENCAPGLQTPPPIPPPPPQPKSLRFGMFSPNSQPNVRKSSGMTGQGQRTSSGESHDSSVSSCSLPSNSTARLSSNGPVVPYAVLEPMLNRIFTALEEVKADQKNLKKLFLQHVKRGTANGNDNVNAESLPRDTFPLTSLEAVDDFERSLVDNTSLKTQVVKHLVAFNGRTVVEDTRRKLEEIFSNQVAERYNLSGKGNKQKRAFQQLALCRLLFDAVRKSYPEATEREYRNAVTNWLDGAKDRNGGRKSRATAAPVATPQWNETAAQEHDGDAS